ncbi:MAG: AEC family transporter [Burkholderiales bacterium]|nr:AEC family transporter [Burkholderiales bacterium]
MSSFLHHVELAAPLFTLVLAGYLLAASGRWPKAVSDALAKFVFAVAVPALLFSLMSDFSKLPPVDARLLIAFFGGCLIVFVLGRMVGLWLFRLNGVEQSVFALGGIFANNVLLGVPIAKASLGEAAMPSVALVLVFNSLTLWTLVTVSVEWARHGELSLRGFGNTLRSVLTNPIVASVLAGAAFGLTGLPLPALLGTPLSLLGSSAVPLSLIVLGMGLAEYGIRAGWREAAAITAIKLAVQPLVVWALAAALGLPPIETQAVVLLSALAVGVNVYLMAREFDALQGPVATSMVLSTALSALTVPLTLALISR